MLRTENVTSQSTRTVFIIDDDDILRAAIGHQLSQRAYKPMGFPSARAFLNSLPSLSPGVILIDVRMPEIDGLELQRRLVAQGMDWPVIVMSAFPGTDGTVLAMRQGAFTVIDKPVNPDELDELIEDAMQELRRRIAHSSDLPPVPSGGVGYLDRLTPRERQIVDKIYGGATNKSAAMDLGLSVKTVEKHRGQAMRKMQVSSFAQLIRLVGRELEK